MERAVTCCFTGHRPDKLPWGGNEDDVRCQALKCQIDHALDKLYAQGIRHFICGMARGTDLYFAEAVLSLRQRYPDVTLEAACPCESQTNAWPEPDRLRYQGILDQCNFETMVQHQYTRGCMHRRNRYMIDRSAVVLAVYNGVPKGGTAQTLLYAMRCGLQIEVIKLGEV